MSDMQQRFHKAVTVVVGPWQAEIDEMIAPLIRETWNAGIETIMSCQSVPEGQVWIQFASLGDLERFLGIVAEFSHDPNSIYNRIMLNQRPDDFDRCWSIDVNPFDVAFPDPGDELLVGDCSRRTSIRIEFYVRFPQDDLPGVIAKLQQYNRVVQPAG